MAPLELDGLVYFYVLAVFLLLFGVVHLLVSSPFGLALRGIRDNEAACEPIGYPTTAFALAGYCAAGALAAAAGSLYVSVQRFVSPVGRRLRDRRAGPARRHRRRGRGRCGEPASGAAVVILTEDYLGGYVAGRRTLLLGILFVVAVYLLPRGIAGVRRWPTRTRGGTGMTPVLELPRGQPQLRHPEGRVRRLDDRCKPGPARGHRPQRRRQVDAVRAHRRLPAGHVRHGRLRRFRRHAGCPSTGGWVGASPRPSSTPACSCRRRCWRTCCSRCGSGPRAGPIGCSAGRRADAGLVEQVAGTSGRRGPG